MDCGLPCGLRPTGCPCHWCRRQDEQTTTGLNPSRVVSEETDTLAQTMGMLTISASRLSPVFPVVAIFFTPFVSCFSLSVLLLQAHRIQIILPCIFCLVLRPHLPSHSVTLTALTAALLPRSPSSSPLDLPSAPSTSSSICSVPCGPVLVLPLFAIVLPSGSCALTSPRFACPSFWPPLPSLLRILSFQSFSSSAASNLSLTFLSLSSRLSFSVFLSLSLSTISLPSKTTTPLLTPHHTPVTLQFLC